MSNVKISNLTIQLKEKTIQISIEEARELNNVLNDIFKKEIQIVPYYNEKYEPWKPYITWDSKIVPDNTIRYLCENSSTDATINTLKCSIN